MLNTTTNFPSIHAATDLWEDFAESFVTYIHVVREKNLIKSASKRKECRTSFIPPAGIMTGVRISGPLWTSGLQIQ